MAIIFFAEFEKIFENPKFFAYPNFFGIPKFTQKKNIFDVHLFSDYYLLIDHTQFVTLLTGHRSTVNSRHRRRPPITYSKSHSSVGAEDLFA